MAYGHAERTLAAIRMLVAETRELLSDESDLDAEQEQWLREEVPVRSVHRASAATPGGLAQPQVALGCASETVH